MKKPLGKRMLFKRFMYFGCTGWENVFCKTLDPYLIDLPPAIGFVMAVMS